MLLQTSGVPYKGPHGPLLSEINLGSLAFYLIGKLKFHVKFNLKSVWLKTKLSNSDLG